MIPDQPALRLVAVTHFHGEGPSRVRALDSVELSVYPGELVAVMGPSGSGKSTLLNIAGGLEVPTSGSVLVAGEDISRLNMGGRARVRRQHLGYVFQEANLLLGLSAIENVALPLELDGWTRKKAHVQAEQALESVGIGDLADRFPDELSGGQTQRVTIARALVGERSLILAYEPTGALDTAAGEAVVSLIRSRVDAGAAALMVTHEARHAAWADRTLFLRDGRVIDRTGSDRPESLLR